MSLDSGLGQLKALVKLDGRPLPRLDRMHGLQIDRIEKLQCAEPDVFKGEICEFVQFLKPSTAHASLFADGEYDHVMWMVNNCKHCQPYW